MSGRSVLPGRPRRARGCGRWEDGRSGGRPRVAPIGDRLGEQTWAGRRTRHSGPDRAVSAVSCRGGMIVWCV